MKKTKYINERISPELKERFKKALESDGRRAGDVIRHYILNYCKNIERNNRDE